MISICSVCGKEYKKKGDNHYSCSMKCRKERITKEYIKKTELENNISCLEDWIFGKYINSQWSYSMITKEIGISSKSIKKLMDYYGIQVRHGKDAFMVQFKRERMDERRVANKYYDNGQHCVIVMHDRNGNVKGSTIIDSEDIVKVKKYHWRIDSHGYTVTTTSVSEGRKGIKMHRYITNIKSYMLCDHKNRKRNDNRKSNLRECTKLQNTWNSKEIVGTKGVFFRNGKYEVCIKYKKKTIHLGTYDTEEDARKRRIQADKYYYGEYSIYRDIEE